MSFAYIGCRTTRERGARGEGIGICSYDSTRGKLTLLDTLRGLVNPSYLIKNRTGCFLYCVHGDMGEVSALAIDGTSGKLTRLNTQSCGGRNPVHLTFDASCRYLLVANYATGSVGFLPLEADGSLGALQEIIPLGGEPGPHKTQQQGIHPHQLMYAPGTHFFAVPDKGGDKVSVLRFERAGDRLDVAAHSTTRTRAGAGPRHIAFHPTRPFAYLSNELDSSIGAYAWNCAAGTLQPLQILPATPPSFTEDNTTAGIVITTSGRFVYMSNRGHDSIAAFAVDPATGLLTSIGWTPTQGKQPRFITLDPEGRFLLAANELSDTIVTFRIDEATGALAPTNDSVQTPSPTCICF